MDEIQKIQWFPGHMTKTKRKIQANLKLVNIVAEIIDARIPISSRNPDLNDIIKSKPRIILMNKCDMADPKKTESWINYYKKNGITAIAVDCKSSKGLNKFIPTVKSVLSDKIANWKSKGMVSKDIRIMVVGIPNVGKSSFINKMAKGSKAKVEDRPGVTRGNQWFSIGKGFEILDTPGVLWPKFEDPKVGENLAFTGAVKDQIMDTEFLAQRLLYVLKDEYEEDIKQRFKLEKYDISELSCNEILEFIARKRGMLMQGGIVDTQRAATMVLDEFRGAKIARITLERVEDVGLA